MGILTDIQVIKKGGKPAFAVIPYEDFLKLLPNEGDATIPHEVVGSIIKGGMNLLKAWRTHLGLTQKEVAKRAGITQSALSQMEKTNNEFRTKTLGKLATALGLSVTQLQD